MILDVPPYNNPNNGDGDGGEGGGYEYLPPPTSSPTPPPSGPPNAPPSPPTRLRVRVLDAYGVALYTARVTYRPPAGVTTPGLAVALVTSAQPEPSFTVATAESNPVGSITVVYNGNVVSILPLQVAVRQPGGNWELIVQASAGPHYAGFEGITEVLRAERDVHLRWLTPPGPQYWDSFEVSAAATAAELFSSTALTFVVPRDVRTYTFGNYLAGGVFAVRVVGRVGPVRHRAVPAWNSQTGTTATSVALTPNLLEARQGDLIGFVATVAGKPSQKCTWTVDGCQIVEENDQTITVRVGNGVNGVGVQAGAFDDTAVFESSATYIPPRTPLGITVRNVGDGQRVIASWDDMYLNNAFAANYRVYVGTVRSTLLTSGINRYTPQTSITLDSLVAGQTYYILVRGVNAGGLESQNGIGDAVEFTPVVEPIGTAAVRKTGLPSFTLPPGESTTIDLREHVYAGTDEQWAEDITVSVSFLGDGALYTVTGYELELSVSEAAVVGDEPTVALIRISKEGCLPFWTATTVSVGPTEVHEEAVSLAGEHLSSIPSQPNYVLLPDAQPVLYSSWTDGLERLCHRIATSVRLDIADTPTNDTVATLDLTSVEQDGRPAVVVYASPQGLQTILVSTEPAQGIIRTTPVLPQGDIAKVELVTPSGESVWDELNWEAILASTSGERAYTWRRVLTAAEQLYDVGHRYLPQPVVYSAPIFYGGTWFDQSRYPADATLIEIGEYVKAVQYRGGLMTEGTVASAPTVANFVVTPITAGQQTGLRVVWQLRHPIDDSIVELPVVVRAVRPERTDAIEIRGIGRADFHALLPNTIYNISILEAEVLQVRTPRPPVGLRVQGGVVGDGEYRYTYTLTNVSQMTNWTDAFGDDHTDTTVVVLSDELVSQHRIIVRYPDGDSGTTALNATADTEWGEPASSSSIRRLVEVGRSTPVNGVTVPTFLNTQYVGSVEFSLGTNIYEAGSWTVYPEGHLPTGMTGRLEDYVKCTFMTNEGVNYTEHPTLAVPTELALQVRIEAQEGLSPIFYGARTVRTA